MQHNERRMSGGSVANETEAPDLLQRKPEGIDVGTLAQRRVVAAHRPAILTAITRQYREFWRKLEESSLHTASDPGWR
ncbi:hypothetical protein OKW41_003103 [Paraburkholderia sp. UCT70]